MIDTLCVVRPEQAQPATPPGPLAHLASSPHLHPRLAARPTALPERGVLLLADGGSLDGEAAAEVDAWVARGNGLVLLGTALADVPAGDWPAWLDAATRRPTPATEIMAAVASPDHPVTARLDTPFATRGAWCLPARLPAEATPLLSVPWQYQERPLAFALAHGAGQIVYLGVGSLDTLAEPTWQRLLARALRFVGGWRPRTEIGVALVGYGAIGRAHGEALGGVPGLRFVGVCDRSPARRAEAELLFPGIATFASTAELAAAADAAVAIVSTPPNTHAEVTAELLQADRHVVVEKPFSLTTAEADELIALAAARGRALTVYQNRRWDPDFLAIRAALEGGALGDVFHAETFQGGWEHPCSYWHSHEPISGGVFYDWGSHYVDWLLQLFAEPVVRVVASAHKRVWHDVTNADQARVQIRFADGREAEFLYSDVAAALKPKWYLLGTRGALVADWRETAIHSRHWTGDLIEERLAPAEALPTVTLHRPTATGATDRHTLGLPPALVHPFHRNLADHLLDDEPLAVTPASVRRVIAVLEAAQHSATHDAAPVYLGD